MKLNIFLDDYRQPQDAYSYTKNEIYLTEKWEIAKNYNQFRKKLLFKLSKGWELGIISFDHDLCPGHYHKNMQEGIIDYKSTDFHKNEHKTGYHCAEYLINYCKKYKIPMPKYLCHSANPIGKENILNLLKNYELRTEGQRD